MSKDWFADVKSFCEAMGQRVGTTPMLPAKDVVDLRIALNEEEFNELVDAVIARDVPAVADSIVDMIYVLLGMAVQFGIDVRPVWDAVHAANMAKVGGEVRSDGKRMKPDGWKPPDVAGILARQGSLR